MTKFPISFMGTSRTGRRIADPVTVCSSEVLEAEAGARADRFHAASGIRWAEAKAGSRLPIRWTTTLSGPVARAPGVSAVRWHDLMNGIARREKSRSGPKMLQERPQRKRSTDSIGNSQSRFLLTTTTSFMWEASLFTSQQTVATVGRLSVRT